MFLILRKICSIAQRLVQAQRLVHLPYLIKMFFSAKAMFEFFQLLYLNFNLKQYVKKKLHINSKNLIRFCRNLALKLVQEH